MLRDLGFDLVLAPGVDADGWPAGGAIGNRAFATTRAEAGARAAAFAEGVRRAGGVLRLRGKDPAAMVCRWEALSAPRLGRAPPQAWRPIT